MTKGTGAAEVGEALTRARDVCERAERHSDLHLVLYMLAGFPQPPVPSMRMDSASPATRSRWRTSQRGWPGTFPPKWRAPRYLGTLGASLWLSGDFARCLDVSRTAMAAAGASRCGFVQVGMAHPSVVAHCNAGLRALVPRIPWTRR